MARQSARRPRAPGAFGLFSFPHVGSTHLAEVPWENPPVRAPVPAVAPGSSHKKLVVGAGVGVLLLLALGSNKKIRGAASMLLNQLTTEAGKLAFKASLLVLPTSKSGPQYADAVIAAATSVGLSPFVLSAVLDHESGFGERLSPPGPKGVGDKAPRWVKESALSTTYSFAKDMGLLTGRRVEPGAAYTDPLAARLYGGKTGTNTGKEARVEVLPPLMPGATVRGFGMGIGQLDVATSGLRDWMMTGAWIDPTQNILQSARILKAKFVEVRAALPNLSEADTAVAALSAYNRGSKIVIQNVKAGLAPDAGGQNGLYGSDRFAAAMKAQAAFTKAA